MDDAQALKIGQAMSKNLKETKCSYISFNQGGGQGQEYLSLDDIQNDDLEVEEWKHFVKDNEIDIFSSATFMPNSKEMASTSHNVDRHGVNGANMRNAGYKVRFEQYKSLVEKYCNKTISTLRKQYRFNTSPEGSLLHQTLAELDIGCANPTDYEKTYYQFCEKHRELIEYCNDHPSTNQNDIITIARAIAKARMMINIQSYHNQYVEEHVGNNKPKKLTLKNFLKNFITCNDAVKNADPLMKMGSTQCLAKMYYGDRSLTTYNKVNPPNLRDIEEWKVGDELRTIYHLRHSTPNAYHLMDKDYSYMQEVQDHAASNLTTQDYFTVIDPCFTAFLEAAKAAGEGVFYACHQKIKDPHEGKRTKKITELKEENLLLLFQSVEFPLFMNGADTFAELKKQLIHSFAEGEWNRLPRQLQGDQAYKQAMEAIFDHVHKEFFNGKANIQQNISKTPRYEGIKNKYAATEAQACIMLFYHFQREHLKFYTNAHYNYKTTYYNSGCKDNYDRGGANNVVTSLVHLVAQYGSDIPHEWLWAVITSCLGATIHGKGKYILPYRLEPALEVCALLGTLATHCEKEDLKRKMQLPEKLMGATLTQTGLPLLPNQEAVKAPNPSF